MLESYAIGAVIDVVLRRLTQGCVRLMAVFMPSWRFRTMVPEIESIRKRLAEANSDIESVSELCIPPEITSDMKILVRHLERLGIKVPGCRNIVEWIDWLPYLQILAEEKRLDDARQTDPYTHMESLHQC